MGPPSLPGAAVWTRWGRKLARAGPDMRSVPGAGMEPPEPDLLETREGRACKTKPGQYRMCSKPKKIWLERETRKQQVSTKEQRWQTLRKEWWEKCRFPTVCRPVKACVTPFQGILRHLLISEYLPFLTELDFSVAWNQYHLILLS